MKAVYVNITDAILDWAIKMADRVGTDANTRGLLVKWRSGEKKPTVSQILKVSKKIEVPFGFFFLKEPPVESFPLAEFRTVRSRGLPYEPSANLLDTVDDMENIQDWMRDYVKDMGMGKLSFAGSCRKERMPLEIVRKMRKDLTLTEDWMLPQEDARDSFNFLRGKCQALGILVMMNGIVENNTHRKLDIREFRAFTLVDDYAPLIFINACDSWNGRLFSLLHEMTHIWIGEDSLYNKAELGQFHKVSQVEKICNAVAAELLIPIKLFAGKWNGEIGSDESKIAALAKKFTASQVVVARRALDAHFITQNQYEMIAELAFQKYEEQKGKEGKHTGGNYINNLSNRIDNRFIKALASSMESGRTLYTDGYHLTNTNRSTFAKLYRNVRGKGVAAYE